MESVKKGYGKLYAINIIMGLRASAETMTPGNISAWYLFTALGFYPVAPGDNHYWLGSPLVKSAEIQLPNGRQLKIKAIKQSRKMYTSVLCVGTDNLSATQDFPPGYCKGRSVGVYDVLEAEHQGIRIRFIHAKNRLPGSRLRVNYPVFAMTEHKFVNFIAVEQPFNTTVCSPGDDRQGSIGTRAALFNGLIDFL